MSNCEWMFADAASGILGFNELAHLNPLRWSGPQSFEKAIADLEAVLTESDRPILVKVPANTLDCMECSSTREAIDCLKSMDPRRAAQVRAAAAAAAAAEEAEAEAAAKAKAERITALGSAAEAARALVATRQEAARKVAEEVVEAKSQACAAQEAAWAARAELAAAQMAAEAAEAAVVCAKSDLTCEWMFGDSGLGSVGLALAKMNPLRWSGAGPVDDCVSQLRALKQDEAERPIVVRMKDEETSLASAEEAADFVERACPAKKAAKQASAGARSQLEEAMAKEAGLREKLTGAQQNEKKAVASE